MYVLIIHFWSLMISKQTKSSLAIKMNELLLENKMRYVSMSILFMTEDVKDWNQIKYFLIIAALFNWINMYLVSHLCGPIDWISYCNGINFYELTVLTACTFQFSNFKCYCFDCVWLSNISIMAILKKH